MKKLTSVCSTLITLCFILHFGMFASCSDSDEELSEYQALTDSLRQNALDNKVSIYIPSTIDVDTPIDNTSYVNEVMRQMSQFFGGATALASQGAWLGNDGELVVEDITIVYSYCTKEQLEKNLSEVVNLCKKLKEEMNQEAISLEINAELYFI